jgi:hypothetical protein
MSRFVRPFIAALGLIAGVFVPAAATAQQPGQGPPMPLAVDLAKVATGAWAEYAMSVGTMPPMKTRMSLVGKTPGANTVEMTVEGGMMAMAGGKMIMQTVVDADTTKESPVKKLVMQLGTNDPMEMPLDPAHQRQFKKPNPKNLVKEETIKVAAGSFKTKHYRDKTAQGDTFDFWVSDSAPPLGLVKIEGEQKSNPAARGPVKFELTAMGKDAKPAITKAPKPFDQQVFMQQMMGGAGAAPPPGAGGPPAPAAGGAPAAAPKKK